MRAVAWAMGQSFGEEVALKLGLDPRAECVGGSLGGW